ncbi:dickkopf-related protein [Candidatus Pacearchaeota archaeon]|nr:dickkopf-related protein [Candidatus Pacearchaeota archaeon]
MKRRKREKISSIKWIIIGLISLIFLFFVFNTFTGKVINGYASLGESCLTQDCCCGLSCSKGVCMNFSTSTSCTCPPGANCNCVGPMSVSCSNVGDSCTSSSDCCSDMGLSCNQGICASGVSFSDKRVLTLNLMPNHEDSNIFVYINLNAITNLNSYTQLGFTIRKENGIIYAPLGSELTISNFVRFPFQNKIYSTSVANLNPNSTYEVCLNGIQNYVTTGDFNCVNITTEPKKQSVVLILRNYDLDSEENELVGSWINKLKIDTNLIIKQLNLSAGTSSGQLYKILNLSYATSNLKYVIFVGWDIPIPEIDTDFMGRIYSLSPYHSLSYDVTNNDNGFYNPHNSLNEVTVAVIRPNDKNKSEMVSYFNRLFHYYNGGLNYNKRILMANSMIPADFNNAPSDYINSQYPLSSIDWLDGITNYYNYTQGIEWQNSYKNYLNNSYNFLIVDAHGGADGHMPRSGPYQSQQITANFIRQANPKIKYIIGISCNIGNLKSGYESSGFPSPMASYVFSGDSLVGLGAEMPYTDVNGQTSKRIYESLLLGNNIGDASRRYGFVVFGDPFIKETSLTCNSLGKICSSSEDCCSGLICVKGLCTSSISSSIVSSENKSQINSEEPPIISAEEQFTTTSPESQIISEEEQPTISESTSSVNRACEFGCLSGDKCLPYGYRIGTKYCDITNNLLKQKSVSLCNNNFECISNSCIDGQCVEPGVWTRLINWFRNLFG